MDAGRGREGALVVSSRGDGGPGAIHAIAATHVYKLSTNPRLCGGGRKYTLEYYYSLRTSHSVCHSRSSLFSKVTTIVEPSIVQEQPDGSIGANNGDQ